VAGGVEQMLEARAELLPTRVLETQPGADAAAEGPELVAPQEIGEAAIAGQDDAEEGARIEVGTGEQAQLAEDEGLHLLDFVDQEHGAEQRALQMREPPLPQGLEAIPAVVRLKDDAEEIAELTVEVGHVRLDGKPIPRTEKREVRQTIIYKAGDPLPWLKTERGLDSGAESRRRAGARRCCA
jgi:hypothetical protein